MINFLAQLRYIHFLLSFSPALSLYVCLFPLSFTPSFRIYLCLSSLSLTSPTLSLCFPLSHSLTHTHTLTFCLAKLLLNITTHLNLDQVYIPASQAYTQAFRPPKTIKLPFFLTIHFTIFVIISFAMIFIQSFGVYL